VAPATSLVRDEVANQQRRRAPTRRTNHDAIK